MKKLRARFKLWLSTEDVEGVFGDGKWRLLKSIDAKGSLKLASESLHISYRKAWGDLKKAQDGSGIRDRGSEKASTSLLIPEPRPLTPQKHMKGLLKCPKR